MKLQTLIVATFLIALISAMTIFAAVNSAQHVAPTAQMLKKDNEDLRGQPYYPPLPSGYPSVLPSGYPSASPST